MNKTIIINIGGTIFHIEEDAYELLKNYMTEVKRSLSTNTDSFEIITDIENRFAELFNHFLETQGKQVIVAEDVKVVMAQMGNPSDFNNQEEKENMSGSAKSTNSYQTDEKTTSSRRLFRDPDDKIIGGVCSGVAHYFDIDPVWIRITLGLLFFAGGIGFIPYVIFWIAVPVAKTRADRIAMKGGVVNLDTLRQSFETEVKDLGQRADQWRKQNLNSDTSGRVKNFFGEVFEVLGKLIIGAIKLAGGFFALLFLFVGGVLLIAFFVVAVALIFGVHNHDFTDLPLDIIPESYRVLTFITGFVLGIIPLLLLFLFGLRILFKRITLNSQLLQGLGILWFIALGVGVFIASEISSAYKHHATATQEISISENPSHAFRLRMDEDLFADSLNKKGFLFNDPSLRERRHRFGLHLGGDYEEFGIHHAYFHIEKSNNGSTYIREKFTALGPNYETAAKNATEILFPFQQKDSLLLVGRRISYPSDKAYRGQDGEVILYLPVGYTIWIDENTKDMVRGNWVDDLGREYEYHGKPQEAYIMTENGLKPKFGDLKPDLDEKDDSIDRPEKPEGPQKPEAPEKKEAPEKTKSL